MARSRVTSGEVMAVRFVDSADCIGIIAGQLSHGEGSCLVRSEHRRIRDRRVSDSEEVTDLMSENGLEIIGDSGVARRDLHIPVDLNVCIVDFTCLDVERESSQRQGIPGIFIGFGPLIEKRNQISVPLCGRSLAVIWIVSVEFVSIALDEPEIKEGDRGVLSIAAIGFLPSSKGEICDPCELGAGAIWIRIKLLTGPFIDAKPDAFLRPIKRFVFSFIATDAYRILRILGARTLGRIAAPCSAKRVGRDRCQERKR